MATTDSIPPAPAAPAEPHPRSLAPRRFPAPCGNPGLATPTISHLWSSQGPLLRNNSALFLSLLLSVGPLTAACKKVSADPAVPEEPTVTAVVNEANPNGWLKQTIGNGPPTLTFVKGAATPPVGKGSVRFTTAPNYNHSFSFARIRSTTFAGTPLANMTELSYYTYVERRDSTVDTPFIVMAIDNNGDGTIDDELNFGPWYQTGRFILPGGVPDQGSSRLNIWQKWDALRGGWFAFTSVLEDPDHSGHVITMAAYKTLYPKAVIRNLANGLGGFRIHAGGPIFSNNFIGYVDKLNIGVSGTTTTYDFEE